MGTLSLDVPAHAPSIYYWRGDDIRGLYRLHASSRRTQRSQRICAVQTARADAPAPEVHRSQVWTSIGAPMIIINADDWGRSEAETDIALRCFKAGRITSVTAMVLVPAPAA